MQGNETNRSPASAGGFSQNGQINAQMLLAGGGPLRGPGKVTRPLRGRLRTNTATPTSTMFTLAVPGLGPGRLRHTWEQNGVADLISPGGATGGAWGWVFVLILTGSARICSIWNWVSAYLFSFTLGHRLKPKNSTSWPKITLKHLVYLQYYV